LLRRLDVLNFCSLTAHALWPVQIILIRVLSKFLQTTVVVMANINVGLAQLLGDLCKRTTLIEMEPQRLSLALGQAIPDISPSIPAKKPFSGVVVLCSFGAA
jgi:hypothetical protein